MVHVLCCSKRGVEIEAVVGLHRRSQPDSFTVRVPVSQIIPNHKYNNPTSPFATRGTSDIMLLKLAYPVEFNDAVSPVCLPSLFQVLPAGKSCYSSGWGQLSSKVKPNHWFILVVGYRLCKHLITFINKTWPLR